MGAARECRKCPDRWQNSVSRASQSSPEIGYAASRIARQVCRGSSASEASRGLVAACCSLRWKKKKSLHQLGCARSKTATVLRNLLVIALFIFYRPDGGRGESAKRCRSKARHSQSFLRKTT